MTKIRRALTGCALAFMITAAASLSAFAQASVKDRELQPAFDFTLIQMPVEIVSIKLNGKAITPGVKFQASDDWMRGATFTLKNISDKPISYVGIGLRFPHAADSRDFTTYLLNYGQEGSPRRSAYSQIATVRPIHPGETREIVLSEDKYPFFQNMLSSTGVAPDVEIAHYFIERIFFDGEPDVMWQGGKLLRRDAADPNKFNVIEQYSLPAKTAGQD